MNKLIEYLKSIGAAEYFGAMNLNVDDLFTSEVIDANPYGNHKWELRKSKDFTVVNAIPDEAMQDRLFWEEWYVHKGDVHHHILSLWRPPAYSEIFKCPESDDIHPASAFGKTWYVIDDPDMKPILIRR